MFTSMVSVPNPTIADKRAGYERMLAELPVPNGVAIERTEFGGVPCLRVDAGESSRSIVLLHGGGYVMGSAEGYRGLAGALARAAGCEVVVVDYRLSPEHPYPAPLDDARAAYLAVVTERGADRTAVIGDSAGGGLATGLLMALRDEGGPRPGCAVLISPELDLTASTDSLRRNRELDPVVRREGILLHGGMYLGGREARDTPYASPYFGSYAELPPLLVLTGDTEAMHDEALALHRGVIDAGGDATLAVYPAMIHVWPLFWSFLPEGRRAVDEIAGWVSARLPG